MDWQDLRHFVTVARTGSLSAAAREMQVDHATVSRRVASLENALGLKLIDRLPRRAILTKDGVMIAKLAGGMEETAQLVQRHARGASDTLTATVRISASPAVAARLIAPRVAAFHATNPGITLYVAGTSGIAALDRGEADLAVRLVRPQDADLIAARIGVMQFGLYATPELAAQPPANWQFIGYDEPLDDVPQQVWLKSLLAGRPIVFRASDLFGQLEAARAGLGVVVLPRFMGDSDQTLVSLPVEHPPPTRDIWLTTYPDLKRSPAIRVVMEFLRDAVGHECPLR